MGGGEGGGENVGSGPRDLNYNNYIWEREKERERNGERKKCCESLYEILGVFHKET